MVLCAKCKKEFSGRFAEFGGKKYHPSCFACARCKKPITGNCYSKPEGFVCLACCPAPMCGKCGKNIQGESVSVDGAYYHPDCFTCVKCARKFDKSRGFHNIEGQKYCYNCAAATLSGKSTAVCVECKKPVTGAACTLANGDVLHADCNKCSSCRVVIKGRYFQLDDKRRVCAKCQPRCAWCKEALAGNAMVVVGGEKVHKKCFLCCDCKTSVAGGFFEVKDNNPFRKPCERYRCGGCEKNNRQQQAEMEVAADKSRQNKIIQNNTQKFHLEWRPSLVPDPTEALRDLGMVGVTKWARQRSLSQVALCIDKVSGGISCASVAHKHEESAVSLSYLACMLKSMSDRDFLKEPQFSLDPADPKDMSGPNLVKRFFPDWLSGTVVGEILFLADYALKEISFGLKQVPGIPNMFEFLDREPATKASRKDVHCSRQWFTVQHAEVKESQDGALIPQVVLGVEARRLILGKNGYVDAPFTDPGEPAALQSRLLSARIFEVAKHIPVVAELVDVAKAATLAGYLLRNGYRCDEEIVKNYRIPRVPEGNHYRNVCPALNKTETNADVRGSGTEGISVVTHARHLRGGVDLSLPKEIIKTAMLQERVFDPSVQKLNFPLLIPKRNRPVAAAGA